MIEITNEEGAIIIPYPISAGGRIVVLMLLHLADFIFAGIVCPLSHSKPFICIIQRLYCPLL